MSLLFFTCTFTFQVNYHRKKEYKNDKNNEQKKKQLFILSRYRKLFNKFIKHLVIYHYDIILNLVLKFICLRNSLEYIININGKELFRKLFVNVASRATICARTRPYNQVHSHRSFVTADERNPSFTVHFNFISRSIWSPALAVVIFSSAEIATIPTLFIHPRNSQPEGGHRPETHTRMWPLLSDLASGCPIPSLTATNHNLTRPLVRSAYF